MARASGSLGLLGYNSSPSMSDDSVKGAQPNRRSPDEDKLKDLVAQSDEVGDELGKRMQARFYDWVGARRWIEDDWLSYIRAYHGMYEAEVSDQLQPGGSDVFVQLTRMKTDTSYNRICDLMFGAEKPWELKPSPMPELPDERKAELREMIMANTMANQDMMLDVLPPMDEELEKVETDLAKKAAKKMKVKIEDQLEFCHWERKARATIFEMCVLGTGCFKGPMIAINKRNKYRRAKNGWSLSSAEEIMPKMDSPSMFDIFSDPYATEEGAGIGTYERHMLRQDQVERLAGQPLFNKKKIEELLDRYPKGNHWETYTDIELRFVTNNTSHGEPELRYDVIEYWGWVDGMTLMQSGMTDGVEEGRSYYCNIWHCGGITIRAIVDPKRPQKDMYKLVPYKELIASQYGVGVPHLMKDSQETVNAAARELINNAALSSGPQVEVAVDLIDLDANEDIRKIEPWRVWPRAGGDLAYPAVRFTNIPNTTESMARIIQIWRQFADEETNIPSYTHGSTQLTGAAGKTASGMSMLMGAASMDIKGVVKNIDNYLIKPFIEEMYHFNMQWSDDDKIKGDLEPQALGSTSLLAKEIKSQRVVMLLEMTNNPVDQAIMGLERRAKLLRSAGEAMDIDPNDMAPDPDEESIEESMMNNQQGPGAVGGPGMAGQPGEIPGTLTPATSGARSPSSGAGPDITPGGPGMTQGVPPVAPATGQV